MAEEKKGAPAWMVSFGDMMTLILTFFILLVSMSHEQQAGLVAKGVGSFVIALRSFGLDGVLNGSERVAIFNEVRSRFNLPPEEDPERRAETVEEASNLELVRAKLAQGLAPHDELNQPTIATFAVGSSELGPESVRYLDLLAPTLRPGAGQVLVLEGHASDSTGDAATDRLLAYRRALSVRAHLIEEHRFKPERVEARAWVTEIDGPSVGTRGVDARLVTPARPGR